MATLHPRRFAANVAHPVPWGDAVAFRRLTVLLTTVGLGVPTTVLAFLPDAPLHDALSDLRLWWAELSAIPFGWAGLWLTVNAVASAGRYAFRPASVPPVQQDRAVALSAYACAPLLLLAAAGALAVPAVVAVAIPLEHRPVVVDAVGGSAFLATLLAAASLPAVLWSHVSMLRHSTHVGWVRSMATAVVLSIGWAVAAAVFAAGLPVAWLWLTIVIRSVRQSG